MFPSVNAAPVVHVFGRTARVADALVSEAFAPTAACHGLDRPGRASTAIQYVWPAVTAAGATDTLFCALATGAVIVPVSAASRMVRGAVVVETDHHVGSRHVASRKMRSAETSPWWLRPP